MSADIISHYDTAKVAALHDEVLPNKEISNVDRNQGFGWLWVRQEQEE